MTEQKRQSDDLLQWEELRSDALAVWRCAVPGGWMVFAKRVDGAGLAFYPDPQHDWNGSAVPLTTTRQDSRKNGPTVVCHDQSRRRRKGER